MDHFVYFLNTSIVRTICLITLGNKTSKLFHIYKTHSEVLERWKILIIKSIKRTQTPSLICSSSMLEKNVEIFVRLQSEFIMARISIIQGVLRNSSPVLYNGTPISLDF